MPLFNRFARLFVADCHALLDRVEEPQVLLRQAVREMEDELVDLRIREHAQRTALRHADEAVRAAETQLADLDLELDLCLAADHGDLARHLVRRKLEAQAALGALTARRDESFRLAEELAAAISRAATAVDSMRQKLTVLVDTFAVPAPADVPPAAPTISAADIDIALLRETQRRKPS